MLSDSVPITYLPVADQHKNLCQYIGFAKSELGYEIEWPKDNSKTRQDAENTEQVLKFFEYSFENLLSIIKSPFRNFIVANANNTKYHLNITSKTQPDGILR